jgi:3-phenylpropionate/trans-cinnamate dioxygenase ferredoxin reductase subunit
VRLESVPNALEQARAAASWLCGKPNLSMPWFWFDKYELKLQMAGLWQGFDRCALRGSLAARSFCAFYLQGSRVMAVDAVNRLGDFLLVRRALVQPLQVDYAFLADENMALKDFWPLRRYLRVCPRWQCAPPLFNNPLNLKTDATD